MVWLPDDWASEFFAPQAAALAGAQKPKIEQFLHVVHWDGVRLLVRSNYRCKDKKKQTLIDYQLSAYFLSLHNPNSITYDVKLTL